MLTYCVVIIIYQRTIVTIARLIGKFIGLSILCASIFGILHIVPLSARRIIFIIGIVL